MPDSAAAEKGGSTYVVPLSELRAIQKRILPLEQVEDPQRKKALHLQQRSKARAGGWGNTLEGSRKANIAARQTRLDQEEAERQKVDEEEANIQLENRRRIIARANRLLYDESDRMKSFHSKMQYSDTLAEREAQVQLKDELGRLEQIREERFLDMEKHNYRKMLERELREKMEYEDKLGKATVVQKQQLMDAKLKRLKFIEEDILEGELLRKKAAEDAEQERKNILKRRAEATLALVETQKANAYLKSCREEDDRRKAREQRKINEYASEKEKQMAMRKARLKEIKDEKMAIQNRLIERQAAQLKAAGSAEEARIEGEVLQKQLADEKKRLEKEERLRKMAEDVDKSRQQQIKRKVLQRQTEKKEEIEMSEFWGQWCKHLENEEKQEETLKFEAAKNLQAEHLKQMAQNSKRKNHDREVELLVCEKAQQAIEMDSLEYYKYAEAMIREYAEDGKNVIPLIKELKEYRKREGI
mmetsp:Transcript_1272/g.2822  ORF Transcript_1272/g.2822 Transcript_1272/m.2822 type:complete len:473 (+) Transcript_1272:153-1571(+)|eukprot:CAMPEP_0178991476 /NCGR_PEP_ID=MMETSP0795-20121207/5550_1 /TAXON_ID=88552 /ORGANISM="Amoebophrya sp., Strain Ameob2" /LENGTH=472 /DNA_ID=CAMNT_0020683191 /DNA_START=133 /DNA_END=1551 /DNA_ORIENTATION=+